MQTTQHQQAAADGKGPVGAVIARLDDVSVSYQRHKHALQEITMSARQGEMVSVLGPNGSGKTTLVKLLVGSLRPTTGSVWHREGLTIGYQPQHNRMDLSMPMTVRALMRLNTNCDDSKVRETLESFEFQAGMLDRSVATLSGGERQVVMIARAMLRNPDLMILDEPGAFCDERRLCTIYAVIQDYAVRHDCATVVVSHDLSRVLANTHRVICVNRRIMCEGGPDLVTRDAQFEEIFGMKAQTGIFHHRH